MGITVGLFVFVIIAYFAMKKMLDKSDIKKIREWKDT